MIQSFCSHFTENDKLLEAALVLQNAILDNALAELRKNNDELDFIRKNNEDEHYDMFYEWKKDEMRIPACKSKISAVSARLLIQLAKLFKQGIPVDETKNIFLEEKKETDSEIESLLAQYKISKAEQEQMFKFALSYHDKKQEQEKMELEMKQMSEKLRKELEERGFNPETDMGSEPSVDELVCKDYIEVVRDEYSKQ